MPPELSKELQHEIALQGDGPIEVVHPTTHKKYILVAAETFERLTSLVGDKFDVRDTYPALDAALAKVWDDPLLDEYADYDRHKAKP